MSARITSEAGSLDAAERRTLDRFLRLLQRELRDELVSVWLYGSRARGERPDPESDVDLLIVTRGGDPEHTLAAIRLLNAAADAEGTRGPYFSPKVVTPEWIEGRREIDSFFIREVDRDRIVLLGPS